MSPPTPTPVLLHPERLTWAVLLAGWVEFAQAALALPAGENGARLRESVPDLIMLQAVWFALDELSLLDQAEQSLALDRAEVLVERHAAVLASRWAGAAMPAQVRELIHDAQTRLAEAKISAAAIFSPAHDPARHSFDGGAED